MQSYFPCCVYAVCELMSVGLLTDDSPVSRSCLCGRQMGSSLSTRSRTVSREVDNDVRKGAYDAMSLHAQGRLVATYRSRRDG